MKWAFAILAALSLILFLTFAAIRLWAPHGREWHYYAEDRRYSVVSVTSLVRFEIQEGWLRRQNTASGKTYESFGGKLMNTAWWGTHRLPLRITYGRSPVAAVGADPRLAYFRVLTVPSWLLLTMTALLPALWSVVTVRTIRRRRLAARGHLCRKCGYDLRASVERCPECGEAIDRSAPTSGRLDRTPASP
jgi:hypothetical protein